MTTTNSPLKHLVNAFMPDFAAWLLQVPVPEARPLQVMRLWQMPAEELLALETPALWALVGQTRIDQPAVVLPAVVARLRRVPDAERRGRLLTGLLAPLPEEEMIAMVERLLEHDAFLLDTPYGYSPPTPDSGRRSGRGPRRRLGGRPERRRAGHASL
jgi:hypothetical protein